MSLNVVSAELFNTINADVSAFIRKKLLVMQLDVTEVELHNSSTTKTFRVYITLKRTTNLKALHLAEQTVSKEIEQQFLFLPHAFYWRYKPDAEMGAVTKPAAA